MPFPPSVQVLVRTEDRGLVGGRAPSDGKVRAARILGAQLERLVHEVGARSEDYLYWLGEPGGDPPAYHALGSLRGGKGLGFRPRIGIIPVGRDVKLRGPRGMDP